MLFMNPHKHSQLNMYLNKHELSWTLINSKGGDKQYSISTVAWKVISRSINVKIHIYSIFLKCWASLFLHNFALMLYILLKLNTWQSRSIDWYIVSGILDLNIVLLTWILSQCGVFFGGGRENSYLIDFIDHVRFWKSSYFWNEWMKEAAKAWGHSSFQKDTSCLQATFLSKNKKKAETLMGHLVLCRELIRREICKIKHMISLHQEDSAVKKYADVSVHKT